MGAAYSSNNVNAGITLATNVLIQATQNCQTQISQGQDVTIVAKDGSTVNATITGNQTVNTDLNCVQASSTQTTINNNVSEVLSQIATSTAQAFEMPNGGAQANNVANAYVNLGNSITEAFNSTCINVIAQNQDVTIIAEDNSKINVAIDFNQTVQSVISCVQKDDSVIQIANQISQNISQTASAKIDSILGEIILALILIIGLIIVITFGGFKELLNPWVLLVIGILILVYIGISWYAKIWPFESS